MSFIFLSSCGCKKIQVQNISNAKLLTLCSEVGICTVQVFNNKGIETKKDNLNYLTYTLTDDNSKKVILYSYSKKTEEGIQDASFKEEIIFEINNKDQKSFEIDSKSFQSNKMLFGRFCYCKGQTGYYEVKEGKLDIIYSNKQIYIDIAFKVKEVPQVIEQISISLK